MSSVINYSKSDKKVLKHLSDALGADSVSTAGFDQHLRKAVVKLHKAGIVEVDDLTGNISLPPNDTPANEADNTQKPDNLSGVIDTVSAKPDDHAPQADQNSQSQKPPDNAHKHVDNREDDPVKKKHNNISHFWFDDGFEPLTCARDYAIGKRCEHLHLGVFGRKSVCSRFNHRLDAKGSGFIPCPPCMNCRTSDQ